MDSTPDIEGGQHQSKQRKGRQTSPLIERKLAQWKATSASSDDVNATKRSPSPTQPDGASDTVSSAAGPWRQNRVLSASGINKRVSESPGRRAGSPVSERVKQWKQQAAHAVKQAAQSAQDNKNLNGKKGGNTQQRAASASKLPPQGAGFKLQMHLHLTKMDLILARLTKLMDHTPTSHGHGTQETVTLHQTRTGQMSQASLARLALQTVLVSLITQ